MVKGPIYIEALLIMINIRKQMFIYELEKKVEAFIPEDLCQNELPFSFRYYDSIMAIVSENIED